LHPGKKMWWIQDNAPHHHILVSLTKKQLLDLAVENDVEPADLPASVEEHLQVELDVQATGVKTGRNCPRAPRALCTANRPTSWTAARRKKLLSNC
jgi:hypothetical protein